MMVIEEGRGAGTYGPGGAELRNISSTYVCMRTPRGSRNLTHVVLGLRITHVRSTQLIRVHLCKYKWFHSIYPVTHSQVANVINIERW